MFDVFERYISAKAILTEQDLSLIRSLSVERKIAKREFVLREGEIARYIFFITSGILRLLRTDDKGNRDHKINIDSHQTCCLPIIG